MKQAYKILFFCLLCTAFISCDRVTKSMAKEHLKGKEPIAYFNNTLRLEYVENTGAFLSMGDDWPKSVSFIVFTIFPIVVLLVIFGYTLKHLPNFNFLQMLPYVLIFSGGIGNIIDRILYDRHVTDFLNIGIGTVRTGIFNVADMYVTAALILLVILRFKKTKTVPSYDSNN